MLLLVAFDVSSCFARRMIELTKKVPGLNQPLVQNRREIKVDSVYVSKKSVYHC